MKKIMTISSLFLFCFFNVSHASISDVSDMIKKRLNDFREQLVTPGGIDKENILPGSTLISSMPLIGDKAPSFTATTTMGPLNFPKDYEGKWVILFSHPADFTPVCTTEFLTFSSMQNDFEKLNTKLIGLSIDSNSSHLAWIRRIKEKIEFKSMKNMTINFPIIDDVSMNVARLYGMLHPKTSQTKTVRALFIIDPQSTIRAMVFYPQSNGRNMQEIKRLLVALQTTDQHKIATPANWIPGEEVIIPAPTTAAAADDRVSGAGVDYRCVDWFFCLKELPLESILGITR